MDLNKIGAFISEKRKSGVYLSLFGFGSGNLKSSPSAPENRGGREEIRFPDPSGR